MPLRLISILLISVMMYKPLLCAWTVVDFALNKDYISSYLCENRDRPELACKGKCFLMQKLKKQSHASKDHQARELTQMSKMEWMNTHEVPVFAFCNKQFQVIHPKRTSEYGGDYHSSVFHPPIV